MTTSDRPGSSYDRATTPSDLAFNLQSSFAKLEEEKLKVKEIKTKLEEAKRVLGRDDKCLWEDGQTGNAIPKIQKVQPYLRNRPDFAKYYSPKLVSIGPIHRGDKELNGGERYKMRWAAMYLEDTKQSAGLLFDKIRTNLPALKELYTEDAIEGFVDKDEELAWICLLDGCAVLRFIQQADSKCPEANLKIKTDQLVLVQQDLLLLENQLPYELLKLLSNDPEPELDKYIEKFVLRRHQMTRFTGASKISGQENIAVDPPTHLLHLLRRAILCDSDRNVSKDRECTGLGSSEKFPTYRNIQELKAAGISVTKGSDIRLTDIRFDWGMTRRGFGRLRLSKLTVDDFTRPTFLNLIAYEMCPDFANGYEISSYVAFLDSLIDHADDVKHLRKAGVLLNALGSDDEVAQLFNTISSDLVPDTERYGKVRDALDRRYNIMWLTWLARALHDHFNSPWAFLGFAAAVIALFLTFVQTWLAMHPPPNA